MVGLAVSGLSTCAVFKLAARAKAIRAKAEEAILPTLKAMAPKAIASKATWLAEALFAKSSTNFVRHASVGDVAKDDPESPMLAELLLPSLHPRFPC